MVSPIQFEKCAALNASLGRADFMNLSAERFMARRGGEEHGVSRDTVLED
jgi:hypothetical protein